MKTSLINFLLSVLSLFVLFVVLETGVRLFVPQAYYMLAPATDEWVGDSLLGWKNKANFEVFSYKYGEPVWYRTNEDGFRPHTAKREKSPAVTRVMLFGNSTVTSRDVPETKSLHFFLDSALNKSGSRYEVVNAGVLGYATDQTLLNMERFVRLYQPDIVCYGYCINDLYANLSGYYSGLYKPFFSLESDTLTFHPLAEKNKDIKESTREFNFRSLIQLSAFYGLMRPYLQKLRIRLSKQAKLDQGGIDDLSRYKEPIDEEIHFQVLSKLVGKMKQICDREHTEFIFYAHPEVITVWEPYRAVTGNDQLSPFIIEDKLREIADRYAIHFTGMVRPFLENASSGPFHFLPWDPHCNGIGYRIQGQVLASDILDFERESGIPVISEKTNFSDRN